MEALRNAIKKQIVNNHLILLKSVCSIPNSATLSSTEVADAILPALNDHDDGAQRDAGNSNVALRERERERVSEREGEEERERERERETE